MKRPVGVLVVLALISGQCLGQSMNSLKGLYTIPTAEIPKDKEVTIGAFFVKREYIDPKITDFESDGLVYFSSIAFLPFLEASIRFTRPMEPHGGLYAIGDRMFALKVQALREGDIAPSLSLGAQDFVKSRGAITNLFNSTYVVATKNVQCGNNVKIKATTGYGFKVIKARAYQFIGFFGGVSVELLHSVELIGEYDAQDLNGAVRLDLFNHVRLLGGIVKGKHFSGGASVYFEL